MLPTLEERGTIALITLDRPEALNALSFASWRNWAASSTGWRPAAPAPWW